MWRWKSRGIRDSWCRACRAEYKKRHYAANTARYVARAGQRTERIAFERQQYLLDYFASHPCVDCGETDPLVLEFDHLRDKLGNVARLVRDASWARLMAEIEKSEVVCSNCHRRRTARRGNTIRYQLVTGAVRQPSESG